MDRSTGCGDEKVLQSSGDADRDETNAEASSASESAISMTVWGAFFLRFGVDGIWGWQGEEARADSVDRGGDIVLDALGDAAPRDPFLGLPRDRPGGEVCAEVDAVGAAVADVSFLGRPRGRVVDGAGATGDDVNRPVEDVDRGAACVLDTRAAWLLLVQH